SASSAPPTHLPKRPSGKDSRADPYAVRRTASPASRSSALSVPKPSLKRKTRSPSVQHVSLSSDDDEDEDPATTALLARKKQKSHNSGKLLPPDETRDVFEVIDWAKRTDGVLPIISSTES